MNAAFLAPIIIALVAALRREIPAIDGRRIVWPVVIACSFAINELGTWLYAMPWDARGFVLASLAAAAVAISGDAAILRYLDKAKA